MKKLAEVRQRTTWVSEDGMPVIGHDAHGVKKNAGALSCEREAIAEDLVDGSTRSKKELALGTASSNQVGRTWNNGPWLHENNSEGGGKSCERSRRK